MTAVETPAARKTDPCTSHEASDHMTASGRRLEQRERVKAALIDHGQGGITADELADASGLDYYMICRRLPELRRLSLGAYVRGYPESPERRKNKTTGRSSMVWRPVEAKVEIT